VLARSLLAEKEAHVAACRTIDGDSVLTVMSPRSQNRPESFPSAA
jgi:hypothetical protein